MEKEFNLSEKAVKDYSSNPIPPYYWENDVKEFIKRLKEEITPLITDVQCKNGVIDENIFFPMIDQLAGEELI